MNQAFSEFVKAHTWKDKDIFFTANALAGELGEVCNVIKKEVAAQDFPLYGERCVKEVAEGSRPTFREQFVDEAGDVLFYYTQLLNKYGVTIEEVTLGQIAKIQKQSDEHDKPYLK